MKNRIQKWYIQRGPYDKGVHRVRNDTIDKSIEDDTRSVTHLFRERFAH